MVALVEVDPTSHNHLTQLIAEVQLKADTLKASIFGMLPDGTNVLAEAAVHQEAGSRHAKAYLHWKQGTGVYYYVLTVGLRRDGCFSAGFFPVHGPETWADGFNAILEVVSAFNEVKHTAPIQGDSNE